MIKRLQRKFVLIALGSLILVMAIVIGTVNLINLYQADQKAKNLLGILSENDGRFPDFKKGPPRPAKGQEFDFQMTAETQFETRYFVVKVDETETVIQIDTGHVAAISSSDARDYAEAVLKTGKVAGYRDFYKYQVTNFGNEKMIIFVDCSTRLESVFSFFVISCVIALVSIFVVFILVSVFSKRAIRPVLESMEKQKQFITDAGHEIKTPLAIISANADVLEINNGKSEWIDSIRNQVKRLSDLVKNLLILSKLEEEQVSLVFSEFSVSDAVLDAADPFQLLASTQGKQLELQIQPDLMMNGDEGNIRQLVSILMDNAIKYANDSGIIRLSLKKNGKTLILKIYNTCDAVPEGDLNQLFNRFYRSDSSRARETGGYGIGLSIAKAIVLAHKGKITAYKEDGGLCLQAVWDNPCKKLGVVSM